MDSDEIIREHEKHYPSLPLHSDNPFVQEAVTTVVLLKKTAPDILQICQEKLVNPESVKCFGISCTYMVDMPLAQVGKENSGAVL